MRENLPEEMALPGPSGTAYRAPLDPLLRGRGLADPLPKNSTLAIGPPGLKFLPFGLAASAEPESLLKEIHSFVHSYSV